MVSYKYRKSTFTKEQTLSLTETALNIVEENKEDKIISYKDIKSIRLSFILDRMGPENFLCTIKSPAGYTSITSSSYVSFANFNRNKEDYSIFVKELIKNATLANPSIQLISGSSKASYFLTITMMVVFAIAIALLFYFIGESISSITWVNFAIVLLSVPMMIAYIRKNKPGNFSADNIPEKLLPH
ncbi:MAG TPA: hypothetical protein PKU77_14195 [Ferruginibacter sp.]|nr:hypothetical protein [Ferruginibacter sp.]